jgi:hypothetical protein
VTQVAGVLSPLPYFACWSLTKTNELFVLINPYHFDFSVLDKGKFKKNGKKSKAATPEESTLFTTCSEYTDPADVTRARGDFFHGRARVMLTTERFHFYFRYKLRGIRRVVFYAPPSYGHFYSEMLNLVEESDSTGNSGGSSSGGGVKKVTSKSSSLCLYTAGDALALECVVGSAHASGMLAAEDPSQVFSYA